TRRAYPPNPSYRAAPSDASGFSASAGSAIANSPQPISPSNERLIRISSRKAQQERPSQTRSPSQKSPFRQLALSMTGDLATANTGGAQSQSRASRYARGFWRDASRSARARAAFAE